MDNKLFTLYLLTRKFRIDYNEYILLREEDEMRKTDKIISILLAGVISLLPLSAFAFCSDTSVKKADISDFEITEYVFEGQDIRIKGSERKAACVSPDDIKESGLPSKYDLRDSGCVTEPNQQYFGDCWAYASVSSLESNAIKSGYGVNRFSKSHLCNYAFNPVNEGPVLKDVWNGGGNAYYAAMALANYEGIARREDFPDKTDTFSPRFTDEDRFNHESGFIIDDMLFFTDMNAVKEYITEYGAISAYYYSLPDYDSVHSDRYNAEMIYSATPQATNHGVTVIGWDDTVPASEFRRGNSVPSVNGAWIIKNSWFGSDEDYMYLSYGQYVPYFAGMTVRKDDNILNNYTHAERGGNGLLSDTNPAIANIFTAKEDERIDRVGFYLETDGKISEVTATVSIYKNLPNGDCLPESGYLALSYAEKFDSEGLRTIELPESVNVSKGEKFSVCISLSDSNGCKIYIPTEQNTYSVFKGYSGTYKGAERQSFIKLSRINEFIDTCGYLSSLGLCDVFMQVYTSCNHKMSKTESGYKCDICGKEISALCPEHTEGFSRISKEATYTETGILDICCADCGEVMRTEEIPVKAVPSVHIENNNGTRNVKYGIYLCFKAGIENPGEDCSIKWDIDVEDNADITGPQIYVREDTDYTVTATLVDSKGNPIKDADGNEISDSEHVTVTKNIFLVILTFIRDIFGIQKIENN